MAPTLTQCHVAPTFTRPAGWGPSPARPAEVVAEDLRSQILGLYDAHLSKDGRSVSYGGMRKDPAFWRYVDTTAELQRVGRRWCGLGCSSCGGCYCCKATCGCLQKSFAFHYNYAVLASSA